MSIARHLGGGRRQDSRRTRQAEDIRQAALIVASGLRADGSGGDLPRPGSGPPCGARREHRKAALRTPMAVSVISGMMRVVPSAMPALASQTRELDR